MTRRLALLAAAFAVVMPAVASAAIRIRDVDTTTYPRVRVTVVTAKPVTKPPSIGENGKAVPVIGAVKSVAS